MAFSIDFLDDGHVLEWEATADGAVEQFALDHKRHTGHFPDDLIPRLVECQQYPDGE